MALYGGDEDFVYIRIDRFIEDVVLLSGGECDSDKLEHRLRQWFDAWDGAPMESMDWLAQIIEECPHWTRRVRKRRRYIPTAVRRKVMERDGGRCVACGATEDLALDHKNPFSKGGSHHPRNLQVLCRSCNSRKHAKPFAVWVRQRGGD